MTQDQAKHLALFRERGALWLHDGDPSRPHVELSSGRHSDGYFNGTKILTNPLWADEAAVELVRMVSRYGLDLDEVDIVVGPALGAITFAHDVARSVMRFAGRDCRSGFTEKTDSIKGSPMKLGRTEINQYDGVLLVEDVLTTGLSAARSAAAIVEAGGIVLPYLLSLVNRSGYSNVDGRTIMSLVDLTISDWTADECPLCAAGSEVIQNPKESGSWALLTA